MIDNMYAIMARINEIQSRFGLKRHNAAQVTGTEKTGRFDEMVSGIIREISPEQKGKVSVQAISSTDEIKKIAEYHARKNNLSPSLVKAVIQNESGYNPRAVSPKGAMGLMQIMPAMAKQYGVTDPFSPDENIGAGVSFLRNLMEKYNGDYKKALSAYNAGENVVDRAGGVPDIKETRDYVQKVINSYLENEE